MNRLLFPLLLAVGAVAHAADEPQVYTGYSSGTLTIAEAGAVVDVDLDTDDLGAEIVTAYEQRIRQWRFDPIVEDGQPVRARARMQLRLVAVRVPEQDGMRLGFEKVTFADDTQTPARPSDHARMPPPRYPSAALRAGVGAVLELTLRVGADGKATEVAVTGMDLLGEHVGTTNEQARHAQALTDAVLAVADGWTLPGSAGELVTVPVTFRPGMGRQWLRIRSFDVEVPAWVAIAQGEQVTVQLDAGGQRSSTRLQLLTPIEG